MKFQLREGTTDKCVVEQSKTYFKHIKPKKTDTWLDCGANIGGFSCLIAPKVKQVIAYEPELGNFCMLVNNIQLNKLSNVHPVMSAVVGNDDLTRNLWTFADGYKSCHSLIRHNPVKGKRRRITVFCEQIENIIDRYGIDKVKMDVEGAEEEILDNAGLGLAYCIKEIIFEYHWGILQRRKLTEKSGLAWFDWLKSEYKHISIADEGYKTQLVYARK